MIETTCFEEVTQIRMSRLKTRLRIPIYAPADSVPLIRRKAKLFPYQEMVWGYPIPTDVTPLPSVILTERHVFDVIVEKGRQVLASCIEHIEGLSRRAKTLAEEGLDITGIVERLFGGEHSFAQLTNGQYTTENLIRSLLRMEA